eukprot:1861713-Rhodomonas_salina.1
MTATRSSGAMREIEVQDAAPQIDFESAIKIGKVSVVGEGMTLCLKRPAVAVLYPDRFTVMKFASNKAGDEQVLEETFSLPSLSLWSGQQETSVFSFLVNTTPGNAAPSPGESSVWALEFILASDMHLSQGPGGGENEAPELERSVTSKLALESGEPLSRIRALTEMGFGREEAVRQLAAR